MKIQVQRALLVGALAALGTVIVGGRAEAQIVCDLINNSTCPAINGGLFYVDEQHPTGTGFIDSFLRVQQNYWEQGFNTSYRPLDQELGYPDGNHSKTDPNFTRDLLTSEMGTKTIAGNTYFEFFLDINEPAARSPTPKDYITLDQLEIFVSDTASLWDYTNNGTPNSGSTGSLVGAKKIYDLDNGGDNYVQLDYLVTGEGSGSSDMVFYLDTDLFKKNGNGNSYYKYIYLFSQFGDMTCALDGNRIRCTDPNKWESQAGFEEWFRKSSVPPVDIQAVPEPTSLLLLGSGLGFAVRRIRKQRKA